MNKQWVIAFGEFLDRFAYYGLLSVYILVAISFTGSSSLAIKEYGLYATFGFSLPTIVGYFSDRWDQHYPVTIIGLLLFTAAFLILVSDHTNTAFVMSTTLALLAIGCFKSNNLKLFIDHNNQQRKFNIYYGLMTTGSVVGPLLFAYYYHLENLTTPLIITVALSLIIFVIYINCFKKELKRETTTIKNFCMMLGVITVVFGVILTSYYNTTIYDGYIISLIIMVVIIIKKINDVTLIKKLSVLLLFSSLFFTTEVLASGILLLYVKTSLGTQFYSIQIPLPYYTVILSTAAIVSALTFSKYLMTVENKVMNFHYYKLIIGGLFGAIAMFLVVFSHQTNINLGLSLVLLSLLMIGFADFIITPSILSYLALFSTEKIKSTLYSLWFMSISLSAYISIKLFNLASTIANPQHGGNPDRYLMTFLFTGVLLLLVLPLVMVLKLKKQTASEIVIDSSMQELSTSCACFERKQGRYADDEGVESGNASAYENLRK